MEYDRKQDGDNQGASRKGKPYGKIPNVRNAHGIESRGNEYFPQKPIHHNYKKVGQISSFTYPDTAEDIISEQDGNINRSNRNLPKPMMRK